ARLARRSVRLCLALRSPSLLSPLSLHDALPILQQVRLSARRSLGEVDHLHDQTAHATLLGAHHLRVLALVQLGALHHVAGADDGLFTADRDGSLHGLNLAHLAAQVLLLLGGQLLLRLGVLRVVLLLLLLAMRRLGLALGATTVCTFLFRLGFLASVVATFGLAF